MSHRASTWAWQVPVPAHIQPTLLALADYHNDKTGQCNPRMATLAAKVKRSQRVVRGHVRWLEENGILSRSAHHVKGRVDHATRYALAIGNDDSCPGTRLPVSGTTRLPVTALEPAVDPEEEPKHAALTSSEEQEQQDMDAYEEIWGSARERDAEAIATEKREAKERIARARKAALAALPRSQWRPGHLENFFRSQVTALSLPRQPQIDRVGMRGAFQALLANGYGPEELATAVESFCEDRTLWSDLVETQGAPIWKVFIKLAPTLVIRRAATAVPTSSPNYVSQNRLPGRRW